jgi:hypothetical protein
MQAFLKFILLVDFVVSTNANLLIPGIMAERVEMASNAQEFVGFLQSALNGTEVEIKLKCDNEIDFDFGKSCLKLIHIYLIVYLEIQVVARSSPCSKEFFVDKSRFNQVTNLLAFYFNEQNAIPEGYDYKQFYFYKSKTFIHNCKDPASEMILEENPRPSMELRNVTKFMPLNQVNSTIRNKRDAYPGLNDDTLDGGAKNTLSSWHPIIKLPVDASYLIVLRIMAKTSMSDGKKPPVLTVEAQWR